VSSRWPPASTKQRDCSEPIRSTPPRASTRSPGMSNSRYLKLVLPRFATRTFTPLAPPRKPPRRSTYHHASRDDAAAVQDHEDAPHDGQEQCVLPRVLVTRGEQGDDAHRQRDDRTQAAEQEQDDHVRLAEDAVQRARVTGPHVVRRLPLRPPWP